MLCRTVPLSKKFLSIVFGIFLAFYAFNSYLFVISYTGSEDDNTGYDRAILKNYTYFTEDVEFNVGTMVSISTVYTSTVSKLQHYKLFYSNFTVYYYYFLEKPWSSYSISQFQYNWNVKLFGRILLWVSNL